ncbi:MAG TPA: cytochrome c3 family protein [Bacteroidota bacterium]
MNIAGRALLIVVALMLCSSGAVADDQCLKCHETIGDNPSALFKHDVHYRKGISCADCHGGNPRVEDQDQAMDKKAGFRGVPKGDDVSTLCASCHANAEKMKSFGSSLPTNQWENLQSSVHGKLSVTGKEHIAQCITCHNAHGIVSVKDPRSPVYPVNIVKTCTACHAKAAYMRTYNPSLPVDQLDKYRTSVHGKRNANGDSKVAECASCHGSHNILSAKDVKSTVYPLNIPSTCSKCHSDAAYMKSYAIRTDQFEKYSKSVHGVALLQKNDLGAPACNSCHGNHGAAPPGVESISKVCGSCHAINADLFSSSPHKKAFDQLKLPECETCHSNHEIIAATNKLLGVTPEAVCARCHSELKNPKGYSVAKEMRLLVDSLQSAEQTAGSLIDEAEQKGMEITEAKFKLRDVRQARLQSRTMVHSFNEQKFRETIDKGLKAAAIVKTEGEEAISEYTFRRFGLGVASIIITILAISLYLFIKRIERRQRTGLNKRYPV